jgi:hypothetical protein
LNVLAQHRQAPPKSETRVTWGMIHAYPVCTHTHNRLILAEWLQYPVCAQFGTVYGGP